MKWCSIAPLFVAPGHIDVEVPFSLSDSVRLDVIPEWLYSEKIQQELSPDHKEALKEIDYAVIVEYEASLLGERDDMWHGKRDRSKQDSASENLSLVFLSFWLAHPTSLRYEFSVSAEYSHNEWLWRRISTTFSIWPHKEYLRDTFDINDLELSRSIYDGVLKAERSRPNPISVAFYSLYTALFTRTWEVRYLLLWIALEALFGTADSREVTYRLSHRLSFFLGTDKENRKQLFNSAKKCYSWRSKVVHGMKLHKLESEESEYLLFTSEQLVRDSLKKILLDEELRRMFSGKRREECLDDIFFS